VSILFILFDFKIIFDKDKEIEALKRKKQKIIWNYQIKSIIFAPLFKEST